MSNINNNDKNSENISDRFYAEGDKRNFDDYIRRPPSFSDYGMGDRFGSEEDKTGIVIFPDNPVLNPPPVGKPASEPKIEERIVFPDNRSRVDVVDGKAIIEGR